MPKSQAEENTNDKQYAARLFLFYMQNKNKSQAWQIPLKRIRARGLYNAHKQEFNKLTEVFCKYNLDIDRYMRYFVEVLDMHEKDLKTELANSKNIMQYIGYL